MSSSACGNEREPNYKASDPNALHPIPFPQFRDALEDSGLLELRALEANLTCRDLRFFDGRGETSTPVLFLTFGYGRFPAGGHPRSGNARDTAIIYPSKKQAYRHDPYIPLALYAAQRQADARRKYFPLPLSCACARYQR
jgi:hypothetical protein